MQRMELTQGSGVSRRKQGATCLGPDKRAYRRCGVLGRDLSGLATYQELSLHCWPTWMCIISQCLQSSKRMENEKDPRSTRSRLIWTLLGVFVFYLVGIFVRHSYGVRWEINNKSGVPLHDVRLGFGHWKYQ